MPPAISILWVSTAGPGTPEANLPASLDGFTVELAPSVATAFDLLETSTPDAVVAHFPLAGWSPEELLAQLQHINPSVPVILADPEGGLEDAVRLIRLGAYHYFGKCLSAAAVAEQLENAVEHRRTLELSLLGARVSAEPWRKWLVGESRAMQKVVQIIRLVGSRRCTVLICGETGTGKEHELEDVGGRLAYLMNHAKLLLPTGETTPDRLIHEWQLTRPSIFTDKVNDVEVPLPPGAELHIPHEDSVRVSSLRFKCSMVEVAIPNQPSWTTTSGRGSPPRSSCAMQKATSNM